MKIQQIAVADIVMEKPDPEDRTFSKEFCENLARSIESDGLLHEPIVRPIKDQPGKVRPITGRNRLYACHKILGWETIPCQIAPDSLSDEEAMAMHYAENLYRNNLNDAQTKRALIFWRKVYDAKHPAASGKGASQKQAKIVKDRVSATQANGQPVDEKKVAGQVAAENRPFSQVIKETLKVSTATACRLDRIAKHLEPEQIDILAKHKVTNHDTEQLAALGSQDLIAKAINLIASGMDHGEAIRQAGKSKREAKAAMGGAKGEKKGPPTKEQEAAVPPPDKVVPAANDKDKDLTDEEWLAKYCDPILKLLKHKAAFRRDAILYRRVVNTIANIRSSTKEALAEAKGPAGGNGGFFGSLVRVVRAAHPMHWMVCSGCNGHGYVTAPDKDGREAKQTCTACNGAAYRLRLQD
jgi:ParB/RepB/Spo0J family partition protein